MGYCPECGFRVMPDSSMCSHCGNRRFHMTVRVFWDNCDKCSAGAVPGKLDKSGNGRGNSSCPACSGEGVRLFREMKDARSGLLYEVAEDA